MNSILRWSVSFCVLLFLTVSILYAEPLQVLRGGERSDGLNLSAIRLGEHSSFTRIVFDVTYWQSSGNPNAGQPSTEVGHYSFMLQPDHTIDVELGGFRSSTATIPPLPQGDIITSIQRLRGEAYGDDSSLFFRIRLSDPARLKAFWLKNPARIILDISRR